MAGTVAGGKAASRTNKERHGEDFYVIQGKLGGKAGNPREKGFASTKVGRDGLSGKERAAVYGRIGGRKSRNNRANA